MLRMCKPIFVTVKAVVFDSEFCVAKGIVELEASGGALIKKRWYWLRNVPDDDIDKYFEGK